MAEPPACLYLSLFDVLLRTRNTFAIELTCELTKRQENSDLRHNGRNGTLLLMDNKEVI